VSKFNYGAFIDPRSEEKIYDRIDIEIAGIVEKTFKCEGKFTTDEWIKFCSAPTKAGGLALMLPGVHFKLMNIVG